MYIDKWWGEYLGGSDDSLTLLDYFVKVGGQEFTLKQIFADLNLDKALAANDLQGDGHLQYLWRENDMEHHAAFDLAIDVVLDLAALTLENQTNGHVELQELDTSRAPQNIVISSGKEELALLCTALEQFAAAPGSYTLAELMPVDQLAELARIAAELARELRPFA